MFSYSKYLIFCRVSEPLQVNVRPKGLGLGADTSALNKLKEKNKKEDEELQLKKGSYIRILRGANEGFYGQVKQTYDLIM